MQQLRQAVKKDQGSIAKLLLQIFEQMGLKEMKLMSDDEKIDLISKAYNVDLLGNFTNFTVAVIDDEVVGVAYSYAENVESKTKEIILKEANIDLHPNQEAWPNEWYLEMIAVNPNYQGNGIGKNLINNVLKIAKQNQKNVVSLNVDIDNVKAKTIYESQGFVIEKKIKIDKHNYYHMLKNID